LCGDLRKTCQKLACPQPGQAGTSKVPACPGNYKIQITNPKQKSGIFLNLKSWGKIFGL